MVGEATTAHRAGNPWHDPKSGRFTSGPPAGVAGQGNPPPDNKNDIVVTAPRFLTQGDRPPNGEHHLPPDQLLTKIRQTVVLSLRLAEVHAEHAADFRDTLIKKYGLPAPLAAALAASAEMESDVDAAVTQRGKNGKGHGLFQLTDPARMKLFKQFNGGKGIEEGTADQQIKYQVHELTNSEKHTFALAQQVGSDAASLAAGYTYYVIRPRRNFRDSADRYAVARALDRIPIKQQR